MQVSGKVVVVTGGANGIGRALCEAFHRAGAAKVVVADKESAGARAVAGLIGGAAFKCDVAQEKDVLHVIEATERMFGPIALFCSNAGIGGGFDPCSENAGGDSDEPFARSFAIHVMAHVYAARHLVPRFKARGGGYFLNTISAAGLLSQVGSPAYSTTKHAAVGFAENLAISHKAHGIKVSILCPQGVDTNMLRSIPKGPQSGDGDLSPEQVAQDALTGIEQETFLILPHPQVLGYMRKKTENYDRWISGMAKIQARMREEHGKRPKVIPGRCASIEPGISRFPDAQLRI
jgi:NAD(P)-dependent dehydrogenase (short-subunit alcohol dehydrogenase family)